MKKFYCPTFDDSGRYPAFRVVARELDGFDVSAFWMGQRFQGPVPPTVRLYVDDDAAPDYVANPISWEICSSRMAAVVERLAGPDVQFVKAPLYREQSGEYVPDYLILNALRRLPCLDLTNSSVRYRDEGKTQIASVDPPVIKASRVPAGTHVFRSEEFFPFLFFSEELFQDLYGARMRGLAFMECDAT
jgi:hypothetical protein